MQTLMLNSCNIIRPFAVVVGMIGALWILLPDLFPDLWPYLAAGGVLIVPWMVYRWWNARYNPGCGVRFLVQETDTSVGNSTE